MTTAVAVAGTGADTSVGTHFESERNLEIDSDFNWACYGIEPVAGSITSKWYQDYCFAKPFGNLCKRLFQGNGKEGPDRVNAMLVLIDMMVSHHENIPTVNDRKMLQKMGPFLFKYCAERLSSAVVLYASSESVELCFVKNSERIVAMKFANDNPAFAEYLAEKCRINWGPNLNIVRSTKHQHFQVETGE